MSQCFFCTNIGRKKPLLVLEGDFTPSARRLVYKAGFHIKGWLCPQCFDFLREGGLGLEDTSSSLSVDDFVKLFGGKHGKD